MGCSVYYFHEVRSFHFFTSSMFYFLNAFSDKKWVFVIKKHTQPLSFSQYLKIIFKKIDFKNKSFYFWNIISKLICLCTFSINYLPSWKISKVQKNSNKRNKNLWFRTIILGQISISFSFDFLLLNLVIKTLQDWRSWQNKILAKTISRSFHFIKN